jgi:hypothetical protein
MSRKMQELEISCKGKGLANASGDRCHETRKSGDIRQNEGKQKRCGTTVFKQTRLRKNRKMREANLVTHLDACENPFRA